MRLLPSRFSHFALGVALIFAVMGTAHGVNAQESRYGTWVNPDGGASSGSAGQTRLDGLVNELNRLILEAEKARAADRLFLRDLKDLAARYQGQWTRRLVSDNFSDGNYTRNPQWTIAAGEFWVERNFGLRSRVSTGSTSSNTATDKKKAQRDAARQIFGAILGKAITGSGGTITTSTRTKASVAQLPVTISNAFSVNAQVSSWNRQGRFELGVYQRGLAVAGYRLAYTPGDRPTLELHKVTSRGRSLIERATTVRSLEDEKPHTINWTRAKDGTMTVTLDGRRLISVRDISFSDPFSGLLFANAGSDIILHNVTVMGAN